MNDSGLPKTMIVQSCPLCDSTQFSPLYRIDREQAIDIDICQYCGLVFQRNPLTENELSHYYERNDTFHFHGAQSRQNYLSRVRQEFLAPYIKEITFGGIDKPVVLDIGCGYGDFLASFSEESWIRKGLELNRDRAAFAREEFKLNIEEAMLQDSSLGPESVDLFCGFGLIEHFLDARGFLKASYGIMKKGGIGCFSVADLLNPLSGLSDYFCVEHVLYFSSNTLTSLLEAAGFDVLQVGGLTPPDYNDIACVFRRPRTVSADRLADQRKLSPQYDEIRRIKLAVTEYIRERDILIESIRQKLTISEIMGNLDKVAIYCTGEHTRHLLLAIPELKSIKCFFDSDSRKWGTSYSGGVIHSVREAEALGINKIIISSKAFQEEITESLRLILPDSVQPIVIYN